MYKNSERKKATVIINCDKFNDKYIKNNKHKEFCIYRILYVSISRASRHSSRQARKKCDYARRAKICRAVKKRADNLSFCVWSNGSTRIRSEYTEETPFSRLLRASAWHLISRESYWHFDRRPTRYLVFAFPALILLKSREWSRQRERKWIERCVISEYLIIPSLRFSRDERWDLRDMSPSPLRER